MITIKNLEVRYGEQIALSIKSPLTFEAGDRIGIIGSNGAGKTTLVKSILGLNNYNGSIHTHIRPDDMSAHMQENNYVDTMPVRYIMEAILNTSIKKNKKLSELIEFFNFEGCLNKKFSTLSGGQKQRMTIIMVLIQDSPLVFFDEVTSGLDFETRQQLMGKINKWYENKDTTICIVSHYYEELENLTNKLLLLEKGQVIDFGHKDMLFRKYCGNATITLENNEINRQLTIDLPKLSSPEHLIAIACSDVKKEIEITKVLLERNVNFKRSNNDIQIMSINAREEFNRRMKEDYQDESEAV